MKKPLKTKRQNLFKRNKHIMLLIGLLFLSSFIIINQLTKDDSDYLKIQVKEGDTVWEYADKYSKYTHMNNDKFINWIEKKNNLYNGEINAGQKIILPVEEK